jgi:hypothetical protein
VSASAAAAASRSPPVLGSALLSQRFLHGLLTYTRRHHDPQRQGTASGVSLLFCRWLLRLCLVGHFRTLDTLSGYWVKVLISRIGCFGVLKPILHIFNLNQTDVNFKLHFSLFSRLSD